MVNWQDIHPDFTESLKEKWIKEFGWGDEEKAYKKAKELVSAGFAPQDLEMIDYLRGYYGNGSWNSLTSASIEEILSNRTISQLRDQYQNFLTIWEPLHKDFESDTFGGRRQAIWEEKGFNYEETKEWIKVGLEPNEYELATWLKKEGCQPKQAKDSLELLRWKQIIHLDFTEELIAEWKRKGFDRNWWIDSNNTEKWIQKGLKPSEAKLASYGRYKGSADEWGNPTDFNLDQLREEFRQTDWQDWTDIHEDFGKKEWHKKTYQQEWEEKGLTYEEASEWIRVGLKPRDYELVSQLKNNNSNPQQYAKQSKSAQEWLDKNYPKENRKEVTELNIREKNLEGHLDLKDFTNLKKLNCYNNQLTSIDIKGLNQLEYLSCCDNYLNKLDYSALNPDKLTYLNITDNNLPEKDLSVFSEFVNLELLWIGGSNKDHFSKGIYNKFYGSLEPLKGLTKLKNLYIANTDINSGYEYLPISIEEIGFSCPERPASKVKEIAGQLEWISENFSGQQLKGWIGVGFQPHDHGFACYLTKQGYSSQTSDYEKLRAEYDKSQGWLDKNYPKEERSKVKEIYLDEPNLEGELGLGDFTYKEGIKVLISLTVDETKLVFKNLPKKAEVNLINAQRDINYHYPTPEDKKKVTNLHISFKKLEGELNLSEFISLNWLICGLNKLTSLNLSNCSQLEGIRCSSQLTSLILPNDLNALKELSLSSNNLNQDLSFLTKAINLKRLDLRNNPLTGSLDFLSDLKKLEKLDISNTNIDEVNIDKLPSSLKEIKYHNWSNCKLKEIIPQLDAWTWKDLHSDFVKNEKIVRRKWEKVGFTKEQTREWIRAGAEPQDYQFISWLRDGRKLTPQWALTNKSSEEYQKLRMKCNNFDWCQTCQEVNKNEKWCQSCREKEWKGLTGKELVEKLIEQHQSIERSDDFFGPQIEPLELIPYEKFTDVELIGEGGFSKIYKATWETGEKNWKQELIIKDIALKSLNNSQDITPEFLTEVVNNRLVGRNQFSAGGEPTVVPCYGLSQDPKTGNYIMVMKYMKKGDLRKYLQNNRLGLENKLYKLTDTANGLKNIHDQDLIHRDFHSGNVLSGKSNSSSSITDLGLSRPVDYQKQEGKIYGVLPYVAPEVLRGEPYTQKADIYGFGIVAYELLANSFPYYDTPYRNWDNDKEIKDELIKEVIKNELRPNIDKVKIPKLLKDLIKRCWEPDPKQRPEAEELRKTIHGWVDEVRNEKNTFFKLQYQETVEEYNQWAYSVPYKIHPGTITHSQLINTKQIVQLLQDPTKQQEALELELKKIEKRISKTLTDEQKELIKELFQVKKRLAEESKENEKEALDLEDKLIDKGLSEEDVNEIIIRCDKIVKELEKLQLQANIEVHTN
ncbi:MAG: hypothetical protein MRERV_18c015 [Mycoplasmataceae bacterium RV_VA103A]|nr:MAG: hypothetical protein MRERV_18c015 [Mycoplasmataceae bacterium RV_VA103A]